MYARPKLSLVDASWLGLLALAVAVAGLAGLATPAVSRAIRAEQPRCYWIDRPLARLQPLLLNRGWLDCRLTRCQVTLRQTAVAGWVCFFNRPWD